MIVATAAGFSAQPMVFAQPMAFGQPKFFVQSKTEMRVRWWRGLSISSSTATARSA